MKRFRRSHGDSAAARSFRAERGRKRQRFGSPSAALVEPERIESFVELRPVIREFALSNDIIALLTVPFLQKS
jgi:hypothetical protein